MAQFIKNMKNISDHPPSLSKIVPSIRKVNRSHVQICHPFQEVVRRFSKEPGTVILLSGTSLDCARYDILAAKPYLTITAKGESIEISVGERTFFFSGDPLEIVNNLISCCSIPWEESLSPVSAGLFGYLAYDLKERVENLPNTCMDQNLPDLYLCAPSIILIHDRHADTVEQIELTLSHDGEKSEDVPLSYAAFHPDGPDPGTFSIDPSGFSSTFTKPEYIDAVEKVIEYIKAGDIYQANLSQRFSSGFHGDPYTLFLKLFEKNPAPFFSFVNAGDHQIISTSPERFIKRDGQIIETRPIKGTIPRGKNRGKEGYSDSPDKRSPYSYSGEDRALGEELLSSLKDDAELSMIVDLMRNDLGKVALGGTVRVKEHKRLEPYDNVFHLVSIVDATLAPDRSSIDLIRATFPGGSITGCPKIRSMEIIDELESIRRHVYTGSIGYISFHETLDLSIAIRTAVVAGGKIGFSVGGGIVFDSDPEKEYEETLHKGKTLMETLINSSKSNLSETHLSSPDSSLSETLCSDPFSDRKAWVNGRVMDEKKVSVPAHFTGFQYGAGLFETVRVQNGKVLRLKEHLERLSASWRVLFNEKLPEITWHEVIDKLIHLNGLEDKIAALKLMVARGERGSVDERPPSVSGESDFVALFIRPYTHRLSIGENGLSASYAYRSGLDLITYPDKRQTPLAAHKSLNYLYYYLASRFAKRHGCDEALICNSNGTVSETNSAALISVMGHKVIIPESDYALPSVTLHAALTLFRTAGYDVVTKEITPSELCSMDNVMLLNSLMGAVKVLSIDGHKISHTEEDLSGWLNRGLLIEM